MNTSKVEENNVIAHVLFNSIEETKDTIGKIEDRLLDCAQNLRVNQDSDTFDMLAANMDNLSQLIEYISELKNGLISIKGDDLPAEFFEHWDRSIEVIRDMNLAFESKDWVTVSDLIEYELSPLLCEGGKGLIKIRDGLRSSS